MAILWGGRNFYTRNFADFDEYFMTYISLFFGIAVIHSDNRKKIGVFLALYMDLKVNLEIIGTII